MAAVVPTVADGGGFLQRAAGLAAGADPRAAPSECSFVEPPLATLASTVAELLTDYPELTAYASAFDDAKIKPALAASLSDSNYEKLLPDAPLGHVLELRQIFTEATRPRAGSAVENPCSLTIWSSHQRARCVSAIEGIWVSTTQENVTEHA